MAEVDNPYSITWKGDDAREALKYQNTLGQQAVTQAESGQSAAAQQMRMGLGAARQQAQAQAAAGGPLAQRAAAYSQGQNAQQAVTQAAQMQAQEAAAARQMQMQAALAASQGQLGLSEMGLNASIAQGQQSVAEQDLALKEMQSDRELGMGIAGTVLQAAGSAAALSDERAKQAPSGGGAGAAGGNALSRMGASLKDYGKNSNLGPGRPGDRADDPRTMSNSQFARLGNAEQYGTARDLGGRAGLPSGYQGASAAPVIGTPQAASAPALGQRPVYTGYLTSDERTKSRLPEPSPEEEDELLRRLRGRVYEYKPEARAAYGAPSGTQYGPMAQDMERSDLGQLVVQRDGAGVRHIDGDAAQRTTLGLMGRLDERLRALEGR